MTEKRKQVENVDKETIKKIKQDLLNRRAQIIEDLKLVANNNKNESVEDRKPVFPEYGDKPDENAQEISDYSTNVATEKILENTLRDIEAALKRIEDGSYGICKYCGQKIGKGRMLARPVASACVKCKTKLQSVI